MSGLKQKKSSKPESAGAAGITVQTVVAHRSNVAHEKDMAHDGNSTPTIPSPVTQYVDLNREERLKWQLNILQRNNERLIKENMQLVADKQKLLGDVAYYKQFIHRALVEPVDVD